MDCARLPDRKMTHATETESEFNATCESNNAKRDDLHTGMTHQLMREPAQARDVVFIHSDEYMAALRRLPVHSEREKMTFSLLSALSAEKDAVDIDTLSGELLGMQLLSPSRATDEQLMRFHSRAYVDILRRTADEDDQIDDGDQDSDGSDKTDDVPRRRRTVVSDKERDDHDLVDDAYVFPGLYEYVGYVAGASLTAADALLHLIHKWKAAKAASKNNDVPAPVSINLGGGRHHAMRNEASGFCYVNDVVLAIQRLTSSSSSADRLERVICIDIDVHHGDGVQEAFYFSPNVTTISFHLHERAFFPGTGGADEIGVGRGKHHSINVPLRRGITDSQFTQVVDAVVSRAVDSVQPDAIVLVCGVDTLSRDPLGGFNMTSQGIAQCVRRIMSHNRPVLLLGGGGYSGADACRAMAAVVTTVASPDLDLTTRDVPEHEFYEAYAPDFKMATKPVIHRPNENTDESIAAVTAAALATLSKAQQKRNIQSEQSGKRKRNE